MVAKDESVWEEVEPEVWQRRRVDPNEQEDVSAYDATPGAIQAAEQLGIDLAKVVGTGKDGRITKADVEAAAD